MSLKALLNPDSLLCWVEYRAATAEFCISVEGNDAVRWTADAVQADEIAQAMATAHGCAAVVYSIAARDAARSVSLNA
jgi:imidazole glycerol phosphate synthase subunit HisF